MCDLKTFVWIIALKQKASQSVHEPADVELMVSASYGTSTNRSMLGLSSVLVHASSNVSALNVM